MSNDPTEPTPADEAEFPTDPHAEVIDWAPTARIGGGPRVSFTPAQLDDLFAACAIAEEDSVSFVKRAALERIAAVLEQPHVPHPHAEAPAAGGS